MSEIVIERASSQTIVVDRGRFGHRHEGIPWCGPADALAYTIANVLVLNDVDCAAIEVLLGGAQIRFTAAVAFALTGADCEATLDGRRCANWAKHVAREGSVLALKIPRHGVYSYVSVSGGIDVPAVLGSRTTDLSASFGGFHGRALRAGDRLNAGLAGIPADQPFVVAPPQVGVFADARRNGVTLIRTIAGGEIDGFDERSRRELWEERWRVGHESNRMGYRLHGDPLRYTGDHLPSHGVFPGVIQVPPSGEPIVLLADAHTTGGYPKAGAVIDADLPLVAQARPGDVLQLRPVTADDAARAESAQRVYIQALGTLALERSGR